MRDINDTISAISSASISGAQAKSIIRISGSEALNIIQSMFQSVIGIIDRSVTSGTIAVDDDLCIEANIYFFKSPRSYTGQNLIEIHVSAAEAVVEKLLSNIMQHCRLAEAGEFTLRAYLNGKIDLSQAEAVSAIVSGSNSFQLSAAEKLLDGSLASQIAAVRQDVLELMSLIEAGLDFSEEDIEFVTVEQAIAQIELSRQKLIDILTSSVRYEEMIDLMSVGLAGTANVGKSSLVNRLLNKTRSIVADVHGTTRDVLTGILELDNTRCAIFDCAGLKYDSGCLLDTLANQAAKDSLKNADIVIICIDAGGADHSETVRLLKDIGPENIICIMTKCDLLTATDIAEKQKEVERIFSAGCIPTSTVSGMGIDKLKETIEQHLLKLCESATEASERIAINQRHKQIIETAIRNLDQAEVDMQANREEVATMMLRNVYQNLGSVETEHIDEAVLDKIFSSFCIGK